jgi:hypothetical protein
MKLLISILDIADFTAFSKNTGEHLVTPYIREAQQFDVKLPAAVQAELEAELEAVQPQFKPDEFQGADFSTTATTAGWKNLALAKVWYESIRPLLALEAARRMMLWHGFHLTPNAAETTSDRPMSKQDRAELRADLQAKASHYRPLFEAGLRSLSPITAPASCGAVRRRVSRGGFTSTSV